MTYSIREGSVINTKNRKAPEDLYFEEYDELPLLNELEHNPDYQIELTHEELANRIQIAKDPNIKDFCI